MTNLELMMPVSERMILENLIDEKSREIERLKTELASRPKPLDEIGYFSTIGNCNNIQEVYDQLVKLGFINADKF